MNTKEEIKEYIIRELERVKNYPDLNYPTYLGKDYYIAEQRKIITECFRHGRILSKIWVQQDDKLLLPEMPELMSDFIVNNPRFIEDREKFNIDIFMNISQFVEYFTRWQNLNLLINGTPLTYEKLFRDPMEGERLTKIITEQACVNGIFVGFEDVKPATPTNQMKITYKLVSERYFKYSHIDRGRGVELIRQIFLKRFGWTGYRGKQPNKHNCIDLSKITSIEDSKPNKKALSGIELFLSQK